MIAQGLLPNLLDQALKALPGEFQQNGIFAGKMAVDNGHAVLDGIGNFPDGKRSPAFGQYLLPGGRQNAVSDFFFLSLSSFEHAHFIQCLLL